MMPQHYIALTANTLHPHPRRPAMVVQVLKMFFEGGTWNTSAIAWWSSTMRHPRRIQILWSGTALSPSPVHCRLVHDHCMTNHHEWERRCSYRSLTLVLA